MPVYTDIMSDRVVYRKSLLYKSGIGSYVLNHIQGCSHGCRYPCYAMLMKRRFGAVASYDDWVRPKPVANAVELLEKELDKWAPKIDRVLLCLSTDPFMYGQQPLIDLTLDIITRLNRAEIAVTTLTKGVYPAELASVGGFSRDNDYGITTVSVSEDFRRKYEPGAAPIDQRIAGLRRLHDAGLKTNISMEPYPPPNIFQQDINEVLAAVDFADSIRFGKWNYNRNAAGFKHAGEFYTSMAKLVAARRRLS
jgi:DNA repair photolyase